MKVMNGLVMTLVEDKRFLCVWLFFYVSNFANLANGGDKISIKSYFMRSFFCSVDSAAMKCWAKLLPFGVNCRLQLAGLWKKRKETVKATCFSLLYVESNFGITEPQANNSYY